MKASYLILAFVGVLLANILCAFACFKSGLDAQTKIDNQEKQELKRQLTQQTEFTQVFQRRIHNLEAGNTNSLVGTFVDYGNGPMLIMQESVPGGPFIAVRASEREVLQRNRR